MLQCKIYQTYSCSHNTFTPDVQARAQPPRKPAVPPRPTRIAAVTSDRLASCPPQMEFPGTVFITHHCVCMRVEANGRTLSWTVPHSRASAHTHRRRMSESCCDDVLPCLRSHLGGRLFVLLPRLTAVTPRAR